MSIVTIDGGNSRVCVFHGIYLAISVSCTCTIYQSKIVIRTNQEKLLSSIFDFGIIIEGSPYLKTRIQMSIAQIASWPPSQR